MIIIPLSLSLVFSVFTDWRFTGTKQNREQEGYYIIIWGHGTRQGKREGHLLLLGEVIIPCF